MHFLSYLFKSWGVHMRRVLFFGSLVLVTFSLSFFPPISENTKTSRTLPSHRRDPSTREFRPQAATWRVRGTLLEERREAK